jgi:excisionase family DNA binding protein
LKSALEVKRGVLLTSGSYLERRAFMKFFTVNQLAEYFGVNPKTIYRRLWEKAIPAFKVGRSWRIAKKDIKWLRR